MFQRFGRFLIILFAALVATNARAQTMHPTIAIQSRSGSYDGSLCNARTTYILATDTSTPSVGFAGATTASANNMKQLIFAPPQDTNVMLIAVQVINSMQDGNIELRIVGNDSSVTPYTVTYCTIPDKSAPIMQTRYATDTSFSYTLLDSGAWQRGLDSLYSFTSSNIAIDRLPTPAEMHGLPSFQFTARVHLIDSTQPGSICFQVVDIAGNRSAQYCSQFDPIGQANVTDRVSSGTDQLRIYPNPSADLFTIEAGAETTPLQAEVLDVLGRTVARFPVQGSATFDASQLPAGTYIVRVGGMSARVIKN